MRPKIFPTQWSSKLAPRRNGPFKVLEKIKDNAYHIDLPDEFKISNAFNVADLNPFDARDTVLRTEPSQVEGMMRPSKPYTTYQLLGKGPSHATSSRSLEKISMVQYKSSDRGKHLRHMIIAIRRAQKKNYEAHLNRCQTTCSNELRLHFPRENPYLNTMF